MQGIREAADILGGDAGHGDAAVASHEDRVLLRQPVHLPQHDSTCPQPSLFVSIMPATLDHILHLLYARSVNKEQSAVQAENEDTRGKTALDQKCSRVHASVRAAVVTVHGCSFGECGRE